MSLRITVTGDAPRRTATAPDCTGAVSVCGWVRPVVNVSFGAIFAFDRTAASSLMQFNTGTTGITVTGSTSSAAIVPVTLGLWYKWAMTYDGNTTVAGSLIGYAQRAGNGALASLTATGVDLTASGLGCYLGTHTTTTEFTNGDLADVRVWQGAVLTRAELEAELNSPVPVRRQGLWSWWPLDTDYLDYAGNARHLTAGTTQRSGDVYPVRSAPKRRPLAYLPAGGGTTFTQSVDGALTPTAALANQTRRALTGGLTPSGAALKLTSRALTAGLTPSATITRQTGRVLTGNLTPSATVGGVKVALKSVTGAITPSATIAKQTARALSASATPSGALTKQSARSLTAGLVPSAGLTKRTLRSLVAGLTPSGLLAGGRLTAQVVSGAITSLVGIVSSLYTPFDPTAPSEDGRRRRSFWSRR